MFEFFTFPNRINNLEKGFKSMSETIALLQEVIAQLKAKTAAEREQVNTKLDAVSAEVADLKDQIEALFNEEQLDFTEVFAALNSLAVDIEGIYLEPIEVPEVPPEAEVPTETEQLFPQGESGEAFV